MIVRVFAFKSDTLIYIWFLKWQNMLLKDLIFQDPLDLDEIILKGVRNT